MDINVIYYNRDVFYGHQKTAKTAFIKTYVHEIK